MAIEVLDKGMCIAAFTIVPPPAEDPDPKIRVYGLGVRAIVAAAVGHNEVQLDEKISVFPAPSGLENALVLVSAFSDVPIIADYRLVTRDGAYIDWVEVSTYDEDGLAVACKVDVMVFRRVFPLVAAVDPPEPPPPG